MPQVATPSGLLEPHKIQAALSESILIENSPIIPDFALALEILIFGIFVTLTWLVINYLGITKGVSIAVILLLTTAFSGVLAFKRAIGTNRHKNMIMTVQVYSLWRAPIKEC